MDPGCSNATEYIWVRLTLPFILGLPLQTHRALFVLHGFGSYVHISGSMLLLEVIFIGGGQTFAVYHKSLFV